MSSGRRSSSCSGCASDIEVVASVAGGAEAIEIYATSDPTSS